MVCACVFVCVKERENDNEKVLSRTFFFTHANFNLFSFSLVLVSNFTPEVALSAKMLNYYWLRSKGIERRLLSNICTLRRTLRAVCNN